MKFHKGKNGMEQSHTQESIAVLENNDIIKKIFAIEKKVRAIIVESLRQFDIGFEQAKLLMILEAHEQKSKEAIHAKRIAEILCKDKTTISRAIQVLEGKGLILCQKGSGDKRAIEISLTKEGKRLVGIVYNVKIHHIQKFHQHFTQEEKENLTRLLSHLLEILE
ncbi:MarR family winged helix-turn-helix transcriptional regulator [Helicobacter mustelae]|nr:MarR family transcriptional regulator [Helicobacter mustelae]